MARGRSLRLGFLVLSNLLIPIAVLVFATGFFPYKPFLPGLATFENVDEGEGKGLEQPDAVFDRVIFMVVDALRSDFVYGYDSGFEFTQGLIRDGVAIPFTAHATPPTVTMPRVKALTTGSVPSFLDLILNFAESHTSSSLAAQDTWLAQVKAKGGKLVFYGDDTWLKLFPGDFFARADGTSSFFVSDFTEVDNNVTRHVPGELARDDWNAMIMHYLGMDHIGHKTGPQGPNMLPKQKEMDGIVREIYGAMKEHKHHEKTLLVLAGDHGMNAGGNHGGSGPGETEPALLFASPKLKEMKKRGEYECPTTPKQGTEFHYYTKIEQSDIVPTLAGLMGMPISKNSLGVLPPELGGLWSDRGRLWLLYQNAKQLLHIVRANYGGEAFDPLIEAITKTASESDWPCRGLKDDEEALQCEWGGALHGLRNGLGESDHEQMERSLYRFLTQAQETMSDTASSYDIPRMCMGMGIIASALVLGVLSFPATWPPSMAATFFTVLCSLYGVMMFASSYVEEEQHFWYWLTPAWVVLLTARSLYRRSNNTSLLKLAVALAILLGTHRLAVRWNQTGHKHAGESDIAHTFFPDHHILMWLFVLTTYMVNGFQLHTRTFAGLVTPEVTVFVEGALVFVGIVFKLNFTQADSPELVQGLALRVRQWSEPFDLVMQARAVFAILAASAVAVITLAIRQSSSTPKPRSRPASLMIRLTERLHHFLTLLLMTQTRAPNVPLFLGLELQRLALAWLLPADAKIEGGAEDVTTHVGASALLLSHVYYFCMGGSNSISSIDLSNAYNGVADYNIAAVGVLLFAGNWAGPIWWCSAASLLCIRQSTPEVQNEDSGLQQERDWVIVEREKLRDEAERSTVTSSQQKSSKTNSSHVGAKMVYVSSMTTFITTGLLAIMAACTALRTHLFIWTVFSPKYLYSLAWSLGWHLVVNIGLGSLLYRLSYIAS